MRGLRNPPAPTKNSSVVMTLEFLFYADLILNGDPEEYLKNMAGSHGLEI